jgi:hypothetical protein
LTRDITETGSMALALRQMSSALRKDVQDSRRGLSLDPKVGANRIGVDLTLRW